MRGNLFVISAPSGTGKTSIIKRLMAQLPSLSFSVSHTTRKPRPGERNGIDYHFISPALFKEWIDRGAFLEWATVYGNFYGTSFEEVEKKTDQGLDVILDIDTQGALQIKAKKDIAPEERGQFSPPVFVFIVPPSWDELHKRLTLRGTDQPETIVLRMAGAKNEVKSMAQYDYVVENRDLDEAVYMLKAIIAAARSRRRCSLSGKPLPFLDQAGF